MSENRSMDHIDTINERNIQTTLPRTPLVGQVGQHKKRSIRFSKKLDMRYIICIEEMSADEIRDIWLTEKDNKKIQRSILKTVKAMRRGELSTDQCKRGLEHMASSEHMEQRKINKESVISGVLGEQQRQRELGINDPTEIRNMSSATSQWARNLAIQKATDDEKESEKLFTNLRKLFPLPPKEASADKVESVVSALEEALHFSKEIAQTSTAVSSIQKQLDDSPTKLDSKIVSSERSEPTKPVAPITSQDDRRMSGTKMNIKALNLRTLFMRPSSDTVNSNT